MAVYTEVTADEAQTLAHELQLGEVQSLQGIQGGIENTNYFVSTDQGEHVLTLFERLTASQLPFYLKLMKHLAQHDVPVPDPAHPRSTTPRLTGDVPSPMLPRGQTPLRLALRDIGEGHLVAVE